MNTLINAHTHLDLLGIPHSENEHDKNDYLGIVPSVGESNWHKVERYTHYALGIHPWYLDTMSTDTLMHLEDKLAYSSPVAIGECGLDFHIDTSPTLQYEVFEFQLALAQYYRLPVVIHAVKSIDEVTQLLKKYSITAQLHGFNGSYQQGIKLLDNGHYLSFGGYKKSKSLIELITTMPLNQLLIETDERPIAELIEVATEIAQLRDIEVETLIEHTNTNCQNLFQLIQKR